jgi:hypothetical protein
MNEQHNRSKSMYKLNQIHRKDLLALEKRKFALQVTIYNIRKVKQN